MNRKTLALAISSILCEEFEGWRSRPYRCPAGVWTKGFGFTRNSDGTPVRATDPPMTIEDGRARMRSILRGTYVPGTDRLVPGLPGYALGAISDFSYNLGLTRLKQSTLRKRILAGDVEGAKTELMKWVRGGGRVLPGLVRRRREEIKYL